MRIRLNKKRLAQMPVEVRDIVKEWRERYGKVFISVETATGFCAAEDALVTMVNLTTGAVVSARAAGEFAGMTKLSPTDTIPLPLGVVAVEQYFFCGVPILTIWQGSAKEISSGNALSTNELRLDQE